MIDTTAWTGEQHAAAKREFQLYKALLRPLIRDADLYHVSPRPDGVHWDGIEYFDPARRRGVLFAFHGSTTTEPQHVFLLRGFSPDTSYRLHFNDGSSADRILTGEQLNKEGVKVRLPVSNSSELIFFEAVSNGGTQ
jgi:hypothetical protein